MARPLRITYPDAFYHVTSRGNEQRDVFKSNRDREKFLCYLESATMRYGAVIHCFCLMTNHYHLLLQTPEANLPQIMRHINGAYTTYFNVKRKRAGHLFQGRYKAILVEADAYATELSRYIHLNPVRVAMASRPEEYRWSSCQYYTGAATPPSWLHTSFIMGYFGNLADKYLNFIEEIMGIAYVSPLKETVASTILGSSSFVDEMKEVHVRMRQEEDIPALRQMRYRPLLNEIMEAVKATITGDERLAIQVATYLSHKHSGLKLKEIGEAVGMRESAICECSRRVKEKIKRDMILQGQVKDIKNRLLI